MFLRDERHGGHAGRGDRAKAIEAPGAAPLEGVIVPAWRVKTPNRPPRWVWVWVGLVAAARVLRSRRFAETVIVDGIVLVALTQIGRKGLARVVRDLVTWDNARLADYEEELQRQRKAARARLCHE